MATKFLDLIGLQRVVNNTKSLINAKQDALYKHNITIRNDGGDSEIGNITLINSTSSAYTSSNDLTIIIDSHEVVGYTCNDTNAGFKVIGFIHNNKLFGWRTINNNSYFIDVDLGDYSIVSDYVITL